MRNTLRVASRPLDRDGAAGVIADHVNAAEVERPGETFHGVGVGRDVRLGQGPVRRSEARGVRGDDPAVPAENGQELHVDLARIRALVQGHDGAGGAGSFRAGLPVVDLQ